MGLGSLANLVPIKSKGGLKVVVGCGDYFRGCSWPISVWAGWINIDFGFHANGEVHTYSQKRIYGVIGIRGIDGFSQLTARGFKGSMLWILSRNLQNEHHKAPSSSKDLFHRKG